MNDLPDGVLERDAQVRRGGRRTADGTETTWSVADGSRGRRWRSVVRARDGRVRSSALETTPDGAFSKLEAASEDALLTLHVENDGSLHGHVVAPEGVRHLGLGVLHPALVLVEDDAFTAAALVRGLDGRVGVGEEADFRVVHVDPRLDVAIVGLSVRRVAERAWELALEGSAPRRIVRIELRPNGLPRRDPGEGEWPLAQ